MNINFKLTVLDAVFAQRAKFNCVTIMNYIRENEVANRTYPHGEIAIYLDILERRGFITRVDSKEFPVYVTTVP